MLSLLFLDHLKKTSFGFWENEIPHEAENLNIAYHWVINWGYFTIKVVVCLGCPFPLRLIPFENVIYSFNVQVTATWRSGQSGAPASSPASMAGASRQWGASLDPGRISSSLLRTRRAALGKRWKHDLAQVVWPQHCFLPLKSLFWLCCKVKTNWYWYCRREVLWLPVENQPLARQRTHSVVSALRWNKCHRYIHKLPCTIMNEKSPFTFFFFCVSCSEGSWTSFLTPPEFQFRFVCRKDRWELTSLAVRSTSRMYYMRVFGRVTPTVGLVIGRNECIYTKGLLGLACTAISATFL